MLRYTLIVSQKEYFSSYELSHVIHEMLGVIFEIYKRTNTNTNIDDIYIEEYESIDYKKYKMITNIYYYNPTIKNIDKKKSTDLLDLVNGLFDSKLNVIVMPSSDTPSSDTPSSNIVMPSSDTPSSDTPSSNIVMPSSDAPSSNDLLANDLDYIQTEIERLQQQKEENIVMIEQIKKEQDTDLEKLMDTASEENFKIKQNYYKKEKEEENLKMFNADKRAYKLLKDDITSGKLLSNNISPIFKNKYLIFEILNKDDNLDDYKMYLELLEQLNSDKSNIQISEKYGGIFDTISSPEFITRNVNNEDYEIPDILP
jgi:hypothetical protein